LLRQGAIKDDPTAFLTAPKQWSSLPKYLNLEQVNSLIGPPPSSKPTGIRDRAMLELSLHYEKKPLHIRDISKAQDIPQRFLEQILLQLKRAGYLRSRKGPDGGYYLSKHPSEINVAEVIRVMDKIVQSFF
jgi:hypothetical protein